MNKDYLDNIDLLNTLSFYYIKEKMLCSEVGYVIRMDLSLLVFSAPTHISSTHFQIKDCIYLLLLETYF